MFVFSNCLSTFSVSGLIKKNKKIIMKIINFDEHKKTYSILLPKTLVGNVVTTCCQSRTPTPNIRHLQCHMVPILYP